MNELHLSVSNAWIISSLHLLAHIVLVLVLARYFNNVNCASVIAVLTLGLSCAEAPRDLLLSPPLLCVGQADF